MSSLHIFPPDFRCRSRRRLIGPSEIDKKSLQSSDESEKANRRQQKIFKSNPLLFRYKTAQYYDYSGVLASELGVFARRLWIASKTLGKSDRRAIMESIAAQNKESKKRKLTMPLRMEVGKGSKWLGSFRAVRYVEEHLH